MTAPVIVVDDLHVRYRGAATDAVDGISFTVAEGEVFGFLGPNGAGKSTTQRILTGLLRGHEGRADVLGRPVMRWGRAYYEHIGVGFELPAHFSRLTARENLAAFAAFYRGPADEPGPLLDLVGLGADADRLVGEFSKGMRMRLNLARALVNRPRVLFLDEPTSGMDPVHANLVRDLVRRQPEQGCTVFLTTHDMATAEQLCDRVAFMVDGRIAAIDTPRNFRLAHGKPCVVVEYRDENVLRHKEFPLAGIGEDPAFAALLRAHRVETIHTREASLDDVFVEVTGGRL
ncbi:ABC transporter ATP-binding protein [Actinophytocola algeriensis]|uniref:Fluoroquinolone transport system ATP-binding protein n=1 Tax=Actinophytocola algeriensis TaxID=1768010 RepID=A0A7W7VII7_9PSEU|nr:ABC transporter ATP-binding protein [Actinophytocola algeriensis]MBB4911607.1 fluoroquinolone transport system ATP-binding protein [Actinophytocola algeriensis]MBE1473405.1 fluoroquinolone transport system ATP-binding protein [Actinophytocola algeriensis]